jgi:pimeloyl-ACP methyl ester carboxylesterase
MSIPHFDLHGNGPDLHFLHANGYPPETYQPLLDLLKTQYRVLGLLLRPLWPESNMKDIRSWHPFSDDLLQFLSDRGPVPVIGMGHSIGGIVTLRTALHDPKRFRALVLLDPVLFVPSFLLMWNVVRAVGLGNRVHPKIPGALKRRKTFDDLEQVFQAYRTRPVFRYMSDESLRAYITGIVKPKAGGGYELAFSPEWEAHIYRTGLLDFDIWHSLYTLEIPTLIIRGAETDTFLEKAANLVKRKNPRIRVEVLERSTHLLPLEHPQKIFDMTQSFLKEVL